MLHDRQVGYAVAQQVAGQANRLRESTTPMDIHETSLPGVLLITPRVFEDPRGFFQETWQQDRFAASGIDCHFVQDNWSRSTGGTLRGLHYQLPHAQAKLIQVIRGEVYDVAVDLRRDSPAFGQWVGVPLSDLNHHQLFIPAGCAHGFYVLSDVADFQYKCSDVYHAESERTLLWNDPKIGIAWPLNGEPLLSEKDARGTPLSEAECYPSIEVTEVDGDG